MHEILDTAEDVLAVIVSNKIDGADLDAVMDRLEPMLDRQDKVHVFVETRSIDGIELSTLASYAVRAMPMFARLHRFGRVAVVADQAWIRLATRMESAILPFVSYRTFEPGERAQALTWVEGVGVA